MKTFQLSTDYVRQYKNNGQHCEQWVRYTFTGIYKKADNVAYNKGTDFAEYQIKSARATVCKGTDLIAYLKEDMATSYIYATKNGVAYVMTKQEYIAFVEIFGTVTRESQKNGGATKIRLLAESKKMLEYLLARV
jgi:myo-inositol-hexaphosphate 3-phosphohydrolase